MIRWILTERWQRHWFVFFMLTAYTLFPKHRFSKKSNKEFKFVFPSVVKISSIYKDRKYWCLPLVISSTSIFRSRLKISMLPAIVCSFCKVEIIQVLKLYILCLLCNWLTLQPIFSINPNKNFFYVSNQSLKNCCPSHILKGLALNIVH